jgi:hypothetical protein
MPIEVLELSTPELALIVKVTATSVEVFALVDWVL